MSIYILTSMFPHGFNDEISKLFQKTIINRNKFAFIASEFERTHSETDNYFKFFLNMFNEKGIFFNDSYVVDGRMSIKEAQEAVKEADVIWLSGGDTLTEFNYLQKYGLDKIIKQHNGIIIGMSAGSINLANISICNLSCGYKVYNGLGCVNISIEPHYNPNKISDELLELSKKYIIYGVCDNSVIVCTDEKTDFYGEIYKISNGYIEQV